MNGTQRRVKLILDLACTSRIQLPSIQLRLTQTPINSILFLRENIANSIG
jgi:hypothetical protein